MIQVTLVRGVLGVVAVAVCAIGLTAGGDDRYRLTLDLDNAQGLRAGSLVQVGGVPVGEVTDLNLQDDDGVHATVQIDAEHGPVGRDARAVIASRNLLGEKYVNLKPGDRGEPLASDSVLPGARVQESVDLDQILDVLAPDARAKVSVLIDEVGAGLTGQARNLNSFLRQFPASLDKATELLDQVVQDNRTLGQVLERSDRFIATLARERRQIARLINTAGSASESFAGSRQELTQTLERAPATLVALRRALDEARATAAPLRAAARAVTRTAPELTRTLGAVEPFRRAAEPALEELQQSASSISRLGAQATPVVRRAIPTLAALEGFGSSLAPVTRTLDVMGDDLLAALHGWSRAIQARDGISHMFRAKVMINPESFNSIISRLTPEPTRAKEPARPQATEAPRTQAPAPTAPPTTARPTRAPKLPAVPAPVDELAGSAGKAVDDLLGLLLRP